MPKVVRCSLCVCTRKCLYRLQRERFDPCSAPTSHATGLGAFFFFRRPLSLINVLARVVLQAFVLVLGWLQRLWMIPGAPLAPALDVGGRPAVIFSHGLGGFRSMYSVPCAELASQGYVVLAVEHADGSSSAARVAGAKVGRVLGRGEVRSSLDPKRIVTLVGSRPSIPCRASGRIISSNWTHSPCRAHPRPTAPH